MKISVITISLNQAGFVRQCIESVLSQDYPDYEYIIVDAGSTDGSRDIILDYKDLFYKRIFEADSGPAHGLNKGFSLATGDILYYINADDIVLPDAFSKAIKIFHERADIDVLLGRGYMIDLNGNVVRKLFSSKSWSLVGYANGRAIAVQQSTFFRASAYRASQGFNTNNRTCWDGELLVDMALSGANVYSCNTFFGSFRIYPDSISGSGRLLHDYQIDQIRIREKIINNRVTRELRLYSWFVRIVELLCDPARLKAMAQFYWLKITSQPSRK